MNAWGLALLAVAFAYPVVNYAALWVATAPTGIPRLEHLFLFAFFAPLFTVATVAFTKVQGARIGWWAVAAFAAWIALVGGVNFWIITAIWSVI